MYIYVGVWDYYLSLALFRVQLRSLPVETGSRDVFEYQLSTRSVFAFFLLRVRHFSLSGH